MSNSRNLSVIHLVTGLNVGGAERAVLDLSAVQSEKIRLIVVSITNDNKLLSQFDKAGIEVIFLGVNKSFSSFFKSIFRLYKLIKERNVNILHCHMFHPIIYAIPIKFIKSNVKVVFTSHSFNIGSVFREYIVGFTKMLRAADIIFSGQMKSWIYKKKYTYIIPNGVKLSDYSQVGSKNKKFTFVSVARLDEVKNHKSMVEAASMLKHRYEFQVLFAGTGELEGDLKTRIASYGLENIVKLLGYRSDISFLMNQCHCFMLTSLWEGLPISILEAFACGLPVISTAVGSIPEFFSPEEVVFTKQTPESIAACMELVMKNYNTYSEQSSKVRDRIAKDFDIGKIGDEHLSLYNKLLN
ncbi:glycosyltransferase [Chitinophaga sp. 212800010-3]|uniref:glycosyltransferase n=1 Tax=unclassified Chitinophaga TaxID=2619133 RepID=UPI002DEFE168|nr:hypothetical protein [Chitinophaga sp. 212800010-3]